MSGYALIHVANAAQDAQPSAGIDWVALATFAVAGATLVLAAVTFLLARQATAEVALTRASEVARRAEVHIIDADPLSAALRGVRPIGGAEWHMGIRVTAIGDKPVGGITATLRSDESAYALSPVHALLAPGEEHDFDYVVDPSIAYDDRSERRGAHSAVDHLELVLESHGLLGQRVMQAFRIDLEKAIHSTGPNFYMSRIEIVPNVVGGTSAVTTVAGG